MDKTLTTAATGLSAQQRFVEIIANNLANVNTTGYKRVRPEFQDLLYETIRPMGVTTAVGIEPLPDVQIGSGTELIATTRQFSQGTVIETGNMLDLAINGDGFFKFSAPITPSPTRVMVHSRSTVMVRSLHHRAIFSSHALSSPRAQQAFASVVTAL